MLENTGAGAGRLKVVRVTAMLRHDGCVDTNRMFVHCYVLNRYCSWKKNISGAGQEAVLSREDTVLAPTAAQIVYLGGRGRGSGFTRAARQTE